MKNVNMMKSLVEIDEDLLLECDEKSCKSIKRNNYIKIAVGICAACLVIFTVVWALAQNNVFSKNADKDKENGNIAQVSPTDISDGENVYLVYASGKMEGLFAGEDVEITITESAIDWQKIDEYYVAAFPEDLIAEKLETFEDLYQKSPYIIRVTITEDMKLGYGNAAVKARVTKVYAGDVKVGQDISITRDGYWNCFRINDNLYMELGFHNMLKAGEEYLFFLESYDKSTNVCKLEGYSFPSYFLCEDRESVISDAKGEYGTYVKYGTVKESEFFAESEEALRLIQKLKKDMLSLYD